MNWTSKEKSKYWNKAYKEYAFKSGLSLKQVEVDFIEYKSLCSFKYRR